MNRIRPVPALLSVALVAVGVYAACNNTAFYFSTGQFPPGGANIIITVSDPAVCAAPGGHFSHIYVTIPAVQAGEEPTAEANSSSLADLTPNLAARPVQVVCPCNVIAFVSVIVGVTDVFVVQVQVPDGITTVSPAEAELIAVCTAACEQDAALIVLAVAGIAAISRSPDSRSKRFMDASPRDSFATRYRS